MAARLAVVLLAFLFAAPAIAQNTKGDQPVGNQKRIRETKGKTIRRKEKARTKDLAGRRLRTKNASSENRANARIKQPDPYAGRKRVDSDRPARSRDLVFNEKPSERPRAWKGDISGFAPRRIKPRTEKAARSNVYPQREYATRQPRGEQPFKSYQYRNRSASGKPIVKRVPQYEERPWKGDIKGGTVGTPSKTGKVKNVFPQQNRYSQYVSRRRDRGDKPLSNKAVVARTARMATKPKGAGVAGFGPRSRSRSFVTRGRKDVYWGKFSKGERPFTRDLTGAPLRTRNYRSTPAGLVGTDTLKFTGRRPKGDVVVKGRRQPRVGDADQGWRGDIAGWRLRAKPPTSKELAGRTRGVRISSSRQQVAGKPLPSAALKFKRLPAERPGRRVAGRVPGIGAMEIGLALRKTKGRPPGGDFRDQGEGFTGTIKARRPEKGGGSASGRLWNNNRLPIQGRALPGGVERPGRYSGNIRQQDKILQDQGEGFTGYIKTRRPEKGGGSVSGRLWNNKRAPIPGKTYQDQGEGFTGYIKTRRPDKGGGSASGALWNNRRAPIPGKSLPVDADRPGRFSGNIKGSRDQNFVDQGESFTGYIKTRRPEKGGGSVSGTLWNNRRTPIPGKSLPAGSDRPGRFSGNIKGSREQNFTDQGESFTGYIKTRRPEKGGGSVSGTLWNNREKSTTVLLEKKNSMAAADFHGRTKARRPDKGGGSVSGELWNNKEEPIQLNFPSGRDAKIGTYLGKNKNKQDYTQSPRAVDESTLKKEPAKGMSVAEGLQVRVKRDDFDKREHTADGAMKGVGPKKGSVDASEFSKGIKVTWKSKHNPNSVDDALKVTYLGKAAGRVNDYQGNVKMHRFKHKDFHPDAPFAHGGENNVKEERSILTNVKLLWARLFHKTESQPDHLKENSRRPRYDKGERGLWYE